MANKVANVDDVTGAFNGSVVADRTQPKLRRAPSVQAMSTEMLRSHLRRLPDEVSVVAEPAVGGDSRGDSETSFAPMGRASVGAGAVTAMAANPFDGRLFVADYAADAVTVLDGHTLNVVSTIAGVPEPYTLAVAQGRAYVSALDCGHDVVAVLDTESVVDSYPLADAVQDIVADREGRFVYVARSSRDGTDLAVINTMSGHVSTVALASRVGEVANTLRLSGDGRTLFVATTDQLGGRLLAVSTAELRVVDSITVVEPIRGFAVSHDGRTVWVATDDANGGGLVDALDMRSHRVMGTVSLRSSVRQVMLSALGDRVYAVTDEAVTAVCTNTHEVLDGINTGSAPSCVAESADGSRLYVADYEGRVALYSVASATPSMLARMATPEALAGPAVRELAVSV
jgi:DNA-binding beta-propeller fold protein YncE